MLRSGPSHICLCVSTKPGITIVLEASIVVAFAVMFGRTSTIRVPSINTSALSKFPTPASMETTQPFLKRIRFGADCGIEMRADADNSGLPLLVAIRLAAARKARRDVCRFICEFLGWTCLPQEFA